MTTVVVTANPVSVDSYETFTLTAVPSGGTGPYTYSFQQITGVSITLSGTGAVRTGTGPVLITGEAKTWQVTATDSLGASGVDSVSIGINPHSEFRWSGTAWVPIKEAQFGASTPVVPPQLSGLAVSNIGDTSATLTWTAGGSTTPPVLKSGLFSNNTLLVDDLSPTANTYNWTGLTAGSVHSNINIRRYNSVGWSLGSNNVSFTNTTPQGTVLFQGHQPGKIYLGWSTDQGDSFATTQINTQAPGAGSFSQFLGVKRLYQINSTSDLNYADTQGRMVWISSKPTDFSTTANPISNNTAGCTALGSGSKDGDIINVFNKLINQRNSAGLNKTTLFTFWHEPVGDGITAASWCSAWRRIISVVDSNFPGHKVLFAPNIQEYNFRQGGAGTNMLDWVPEDLINLWDLFTVDLYQYELDTNASLTAGVQFSHRWWRIRDFFTGDYSPNGTPALPLPSYLNFNPGVDLAFGIGEMAARSEMFWRHELGYDLDSNMTGAKWARDALDFIFARPNEIPIVSWFNSTGVGDERLWPNAGATGSWFQDSTKAHPTAATHPDLTQQTGDTEYIINVYREKLSSGLTCRIP